MKSIPWWLWLIPAALLLIATARLPYGYYTFTRIVVCISAGGLVALNWEDGGRIKMGWAIGFAFIAILFNPIVPVYLKRDTWFYLDIIIAAIFVAHLGLVRLFGGQNKL